MRPRAFVVLSLTALGGGAGAFSACGSFDEAAETAAIDAGEGDASGEASVVLDASSANDGSFDATSSPLPANGGFEVPGAGCGPDWQPNERATLSRSTEAPRSGANVCRVCNGIAFGAIRHPLAVPSPDGGVAEATAFLRGETVLVTDNLGIHVDVAQTDGGERTTSFEREGFANGVWIEMSVKANLSPGETVTGVALSGRNLDGGCFEADDVTVVVSP